MVLTNPFPQQQQMITQVPAPPPGGNAESSSTNIMMVKSTVALSTRVKNYDSQEGEPSSKDPTSTIPPNGPLTLEKPTFKPAIHPPKGVLRWTTHNLNAQEAQHYSIVEDLSQAPCAMSALEVLQSFPSQWKSLLSTMGGIDPSESNIISFDTEQSESHLSHQLALQITVGCLNKNIFHMVIDEGETTCIMSLSCWKSLGSPQLTTSPTILKYFDGHSFKPHGILTSLPIELRGKTVSVEVEVVDATLDYNMLLGRTWFYAMKVVASTVFHVIYFPHQGKIVTIDQLDYCTPDLRANPSTNMPFIGESSGGYESIGVGMFKDPFLMGIFPLPAPDTTHITPINMIFSSTSGSLGSVDPWVVPHPEDVDSSYPTHLSHPTIPSTSIDTGQQLHPHVECDQPSPPIRVVDSLSSHDFLDTKFPSEEAIPEVMASIDKPREDENHHTFSLIWN
jgi:hypothetical protein